jgi:hypothetical protein
MKYSPSATQNTLKAPIGIVAILLAMGIGFFATYTLYENSISLSEEIATLRNSKTAISATLATLNELDAASKTEAGVNQYIGSSRDDLLFEQVFALSGIDAQIGAVSIDSWELLTTGITLSGISFSLEATNLTALLSFLDRATSKESPRRFLIKSLSFAYDRATANLPITATIQLWAYTDK